MEVIKRGADRIALDSALFDEPSIFRELGFRLGTQALIASMPVSIVDSCLSRFDYRSRMMTEINSEFIEEYVLGAVSEIMLTDWRHEGYPESFDDKLIDLFPHSEISLIAFGGINQESQMEALLARSNVSAVAVGNFLNYREHAVQRIREKLVSNLIRPASYPTDFNSISNV